MAIIAVLFVIWLILVIVGLLVKTLLWLTFVGLAFMVVTVIAGVVKSRKTTTRS